MAIEVKRLYLPISHQVLCPKCRAIITDDFEENYLSYPELNKPEERYLVCDDCETEFSYKIILRVSIEKVPDSTKIKYEIN